MTVVIITLIPSLQHNEPIVIKTSHDLSSYIRSRKGELSQFAVELVGPADQVLEIFSSHPLEKHLHVVVEHSLGAPKHPAYGKRKWGSSSSYT